MKQQKKTKSIGEKMKSTHTYQRQEEILLDWADAWEKDFNRTHDLRRLAIKERDIGSAMRYSDQLRALAEKRFQALENIIHKVCDPERIMKDAESNDYIVMKRLYEQCRGMDIHDTLDLIFKAETDEEKEFFSIISDFLMQIKQREVIENKGF